MKNILQNLTVLAAGEFGGKLLGFIAVAYMARVLGPDLFGAVNIGLAVLGYMVLASSPGLRLYGTRRAASVGGDLQRLILSITGIQLSISIILIIATFLLSRTSLGGSGTGRVVLMFSLTLIPLSLSLDWLFQGREQMGLITIARLTLNLVYLLSLFLLVRGRDDWLRVPVAFLIGNVASAALLMAAGLKSGAISPGRWKVPLRGLGRGWIGELRRSLPLGIGSTLSQAAFHFPPLILGLVLGAGAVGQFSAAMRIVFAFMILDRVTSVVFFPLASRVWKSDPTRLPSVSGRFLRMISAVSLPICISSFALAPGLIHGIYGPDYAGATGVFQVLIWFFLATSLNTVFLFSLMGVGREDRYVRIMLTGTIVQLLLVGLLAGPLGLTGVAGGFVSGEVIIMVMAAVACRRVIGVDVIGSLTRPFLSAAVMSLPLLFHPVDDMVVDVALSLGVYMITLLIVGGVDRLDIQLLRREW